MLATANIGKIWRGFGKNAGEWTVRVEISKKEIPGSSDLEDIVRTQPEHTRDLVTLSDSVRRPIICYRKPVERTYEIAYPLILLVRSTGYP